MCFSENTSFARSQHFALLSARTMRAEIRGRSGAHIMVTWRAVSPLSPPLVSRVSSINLNVYAVMQLDIMHPHRTWSVARRHLFTSVFESWWESDAGEDSANNAIFTFCKRDCIAFIGGMRRTRPKWNFVETHSSTYSFMNISYFFLILRLLTIEFWR